MSFTTDEVLSKIYGAGATRETNSLMGGAGGKIRTVYVNQAKSISRTRPKKNPAAETDISKKYSTRGAARKSDSVTIYAEPTYVPDGGFQEYLNKLFLGYFSSRPASNTIFILPSKSTRKAIYSELKSLLKDTVEGSDEQKTIVMKNADKLLYKRYIFSKYGDNTKGHGYAIGPKDDNSEYPNSSFDVVRRTNINDEIYYMAYKSPEKVLISINADMKDSSELSFIARCAHGVYVFEGDLPSGTPEKGLPRPAKSMSGGRQSSYKSALKQFVKQFHSLDDAAEEFCARRYRADPAAVRPYLNADKVYTMFAVALNDISENRSLGNVLPAISSDEKQQVDGEMLEEFSTHMIPDQSGKIRETANKIRNSRGFDIVKTLPKMYKSQDANVIRADIMTALYRDGSRNIETIFNLTDRFASGSSGDEMYSDTLMEPYVKYPMTSNTGRSNQLLSNVSTREAEVIENPIIDDTITLDGGDTELPPVKEEAFDDESFY